MPTHSVTCCACVAINSESIFGLSVANREETVIGKPPHTVKISEAHFELSQLIEFALTLLLRSKPAS